ncbi:MAG: hydrolase [Methylococcales bacterium]|nr:MAG: hydrolase [Methylococcales bacterium]
MLIETNFKAAWWLKNAHLQTLYPALIRTTPILNLRRERLITPDHDFVDLDWYGEEHQPLVILLHGLSGSSKSTYINGLQRSLASHGFRSVVLNFRGCSGEYNHTARCYHSGETEDIHFLYQTLRLREPNTQMAAIGFSLGGNVLLKWLGEQNDQLSLFAAVAVSVPLLLDACATKLDQGFSKVYRGYLLGELKVYIRDKYHYLQQLNKHEEANKLAQLGDLSKINSFWQYDDQVVAKLHDFESSQDYYQRSSSRQFLKAITVPTLLIQATDDPFMTASVIPELDELSGSVKLEQTTKGGHVGFVMGNNPFKPYFWLDQRIPEFLKSQTQHDIVA